MIKGTGVLILSFALSASAIAHPGDLDSYGCHDNRKLGGYHCHRGPLFLVTLSAVLLLRYICRHDTVFNRA